MLLHGILPYNTIKCPLKADNGQFTLNRDGENKKTSNEVDNNITYTDYPVFLQVSTYSSIYELRRLYTSSVCTLCDTSTDDQVVN